MPVSPVIHWLGSKALARAAFAALALWAVAASVGLANAIVGGRDAAWLALATAAVILVCALVSSIAGFAFSALAGSALAYLKLDPLTAVQTMVLCSIAMQAYAVWNIRESIRWLALWPMLVAGTVTIPLGVWLLVHVDSMAYAIGLGAFITCYASYVLVRGEPRMISGNAWVDVAVGALGGLAGGLAGFPGAFVTIWCSMRGWDKVRQRAVYQPYILAMQVVTMVCLRWGTPTRAGIEDLIFVPFALLGAIAGLAVFQRMTNKQFRLALGALLAVSGIGLIARAL